VNRRKFLSAGLTGALAGCLGLSVPRGETAITPEEIGAQTGQAGAIAEGAALSPDDIDLPVPEDEMVRGAGKDAIPAITDPVFEKDWSDVVVEIPENFYGAEERTRGINPRLRSDDVVIGVAREGQARAYPLRILNWHEIVNDTFGGPLLVTYCPLCRSAIVAERTVDGEETVFGVSGLLFKNDLVMYDESTESLWSQILATAINGPMTGESLDFVPFSVTTLGEWRERYPETLVLRPPPESDTVVSGDGTRDYTTNPYLGYFDGDYVGLDGSVEEFDDDRLHPKSDVLGITHDGSARAYALEDIEREEVIEDEVGGLPVVVTATPSGEAVAWVREVDGRTLTFRAVSEDLLRGGGTSWDRATGVSLDGPYEGERLEQANAVSALFWFAWLDFQPDTELYSQN